MIDTRLQTLRVLRAEGTVTATALALHLTPSTVSQQLKQLARETGVRLLAADGRRVRLTPAAEILLSHADVLYAQWERARTDLAAHTEGELGELRMCGIGTAMASLIVPAAARLRRDHPRLVTRLSSSESDECFGKLLADEVDVAVVVPREGNPTATDPRFDQEALLDDPEDLVLPTDHRWADRDGVELAEAARESWIGMPECRDQHLVMTAATAAAGFTPCVAHHASEWGSVAALVSHGFGIAMLPRMAQIPTQWPVVRVPIVGAVTPRRRLFSCVRAGSGGRAEVGHGLAALRDIAAARAEPVALSR
jgi:DNA-binding transcriptional LysR family regulator